MVVSRGGLAPMNRVMSRVPDFSKLPFAPARVQFEDVRAEPRLAPEGIGVAPLYRASDIAGLDCLDSFPGIAPYVRGPLPRHVCPALDHPAICGLLERRRVECLLPPQSRRRAK